MFSNPSARAGQPNDLKSRIQMTRTVSQFAARSAHAHMVHKIN